MYRTAYGARPGVSNDDRRAAIARAALDLVDREGLAALSMRRLAAEVGLGTMTLYGYFRTKAELLEAVVEAAASGYEPPDASGAWDERLRAIAHGWRRGLARHPSLVQLRLRGPVTGPGVFRGTEAGLQALLHAGFAPDEAAAAFRVLFLYVFSTAAFNAPEVTPELRREVAAAVAALPDDEFPALTSIGAAFGDVLGGDEQFEFGLEVLLAGLAARLARTRAPD
jgi:AcrR family transcriptional regulator